MSEWGQGQPDLTRRTMGAAKRLVMVMGTGNSGSTVFGYWEAARIGGKFVGESLQIVNREAPLCSCGNRLPDCKHYGALHTTKRAGSTRYSLLRRMVSFVFQGRFGINHDYYEHLLWLDGLDDDVVIDSSKNIVMALLAFRYAKELRRSVAAIETRRPYSAYRNSIKKRFPDLGDLSVYFRYQRLRVLSVLVGLGTIVFRVPYSRIAVKSLSNGIQFGETFVSTQSIGELPFQHYISGSRRLRNAIGRAEER